MVGTIAITDESWYSFLARHPEVTELNFWTPSARRSFRGPPFSPFLFKLRAPHNSICGYAYFAHFSTLPDWLAWESFGIGNGCASFEEMHARIATIRTRIGYDETAGSREIGCIQLVSPSFFPRDRWIPQPTTWQPRAQTPVKFDLSVGEGRRVWESCLAQSSIPEEQIQAAVCPGAQNDLVRYGAKFLMQPRLGQATFRITVLDAYARACAVTREHSLPALEAAHIRSYSQEGPHEIRNGILLRADLHRLFDTGYITVTPELKLVVGASLREHYNNGKSYYPLHGIQLAVPAIDSHRPDKEFLQWHNDHAYRG